jgi:hypothetical protein
LLQGAWLASFAQVKHAGFGRNGFDGTHGTHKQMALCLGFLGGFETGFFGRCGSDSRVVHLLANGG